MLAKISRTVGTVHLVNIAAVLHTGECAKKRKRFSVGVKKLRH